MRYRLKNIEAIKVTQERITNFDFPDWAKPYLKHKQTTIQNGDEDIIIFEVKSRFGTPEDHSEGQVMVGYYLVRDSTQVFGMRLESTNGFENKYEEINE